MPNCCDLHKKLKKTLDFVVDLLYSEDAKTIKDKQPGGDTHGIHQGHRKGLRRFGGYRE